MPIPVNAIMTRQVAIDPLWDGSGFFWGTWEGYYSGAGIEERGQLYSMPWGTDYWCISILIDPINDTPKILNARITTAIIDEATARGYSLVPLNMLILTWEKGVT